MSKEQRIVLSTSYFAPVQYFTKFLIPGQVLIEKHENFTKQTFRNRCTISGANGPISLTIPVKRGSFHKVNISELAIEHLYPWQDNHWRSIESAYRSAPFFQFYEEEIRSVLEKKYDLLIDFNHEILTVLLTLFRIDQQVEYTDEFEKDGYNLDYRETIQPKKKIPDPLFDPVVYPQVFQSKFGFQPNLSALDLLFNTGPDALGILHESIP